LAIAARPQKTLGPVAYPTIRWPLCLFEKVRENGDAAARISSLFRLPPIITTLFLFLPLATWAANLVPMITGRWSGALPLSAAAMSLLAAFFFSLLHKMSLYR
jgi:hypothetical protein